MINIEIYKKWTRIFFESMTINQRWMLKQSNMLENAFRHDYLKQELAKLKFSRSTAQVYNEIQGLIYMIYPKDWPSFEDRWFDCNMFAEDLDDDDYGEEIVNLYKNNKPAYIFQSDSDEYDSDETTIDEWSVPLL